MGTSAVELTKSQKKLLKAIQDATNGPTGYLMVDRQEVQPLYDADEVDIQENITNGNQIAARIKGAPDTTDEPEETNEPEETLTSAEGAKQYSFYSPIAAIPMAEAKRGGTKVERYPFSQMSISDSFLVPISAQYPEPWKTFASTVSGANRRFKAAGGERKFTLRRVTKGDKYPNGYSEPESGARVFRTA